MNEQQLHMINPYSNELRLEQRSGSTFLSSWCEESAEKNVKQEREKNNNWTVEGDDLFLFVLQIEREEQKERERKKDITERDNMDMNTNLMRVYVCD